MNKQHFLSLFNHSESISNERCKGLYRLESGCYVFICHYYLVCISEVPAGIKAAATIPPWIRAFQDLERFHDWKQNMLYSTEHFKTSLAGYGREKEQIANGYWVDRRLVYRIARVINLNTIRIPNDNRKPCLLLGEHGYAYLMPVRVDVKSKVPETAKEHIRERFEKEV